MTPQEIDNLARQHLPLVDEHSIVDRGLYAELVSIYDRYKAGTLPESAARKCKRDAIIEWEEWQMYHIEYIKQGQKYVKLSTLMSDANKNGCEVCKRIAKIWDGRESANEKRG